MDGYKSHLTWQFIHFAANKGIALVCLPPHTSHLLQPLDVGVFGPEGHWLSKELRQPSLASANAPTDIEMLECIARARPRSLTERNIRSTWKKTGIWPRSLETAIVKLSETQPSTPTPDPEVPAVEVLRTPSCARDIDSYLDGFLSQLDFTPQSVAKLAKLAKAAKQGAAALILANREIENLREAADRQERKKEKLPGPASLLLDKNCAFGLAAELRSKWERKNQAKRLTEERKKLLAELKIKGIVGNEVKRLPKRFKGEMQERIAQQDLNMDTTRFTSMQEYIIMTSNQ